MTVSDISSIILTDISREAITTVDNLYEAESKQIVGAVYTALVSYFIAGHRMDDNLANSVMLEYQKIFRIGSNNNFREYAKVLSDSYIRFSEKGIRDPYVASEPQQAFLAGYVDLVIEMIGVQSNESNKKFILSTIGRLFKIATKKYTEETELDKPSVNLAIIQFVVFCVLYYVAWKAVRLIEPGMNMLVESIDSNLSVICIALYYICFPIAMAIFIGKGFKFIFRRSLIGFRSGTMMFLVVYTHGVASVIGAYSVYRSLDPSVGEKLWVFSLLIVVLIYFLYPRFDRYKD